jgi:hypothetical protein
MRPLTIISSGKVLVDAILPIAFSGSKSGSSGFGAILKLELGDD